MKYEDARREGRRGSTADLILTGGRITTMAESDGLPGEVEALAIVRDRVIAIGSDEEIRALRGPHTRELALGGRRVIPGLIDGHMHFARAGRTWNDELRWEDVDDLETGLAMIAERASATPAGEWIRVIGGWTERQFRQQRGPTRAELDAVAPEHPVYVQTRYDYAQLNTLAMREMRLDDPAVLAEGEAEAGPAGGFERDETGELTGRGFKIGLMSWFYRQLPVPGFDEQVASTAALSRELARLGMTGAVDGGGVNSGPRSYDPLYEAWRRDELVTRVRLFKHPERKGTEQDDFAGYLRHEHPGFGDAMLRTSGLGEIFLYRSHDRFGTPGDIGPDAAAELADLFRRCAERGWTIQLHVHSGEFYELVLRLWDELDRDVALAPLRWTMVHAEAIRPEDIPVLQRLGVGASIQSLMRLSGEAAIELWGAERIAASPPVRALLDAGVPLPLGSDAMRVASYNPFVSMTWFITGLTVSGTPSLRGENLHTRHEALRGYTRQSAWITFEEHERGLLAPGAFADLAVLTDDFFEVPLERIAQISSELTLLGGRIVWESGTLEPSLG